MITHIDLQLFTHKVYFQSRSQSQMAPIEFNWRHFLFGEEESKGIEIDLNGNITR
ncbi:hypothetical protein [Flavobacterium ginsenosidimutans]|uniref:hypothetical protein n=1 Tax=Flavobacterium ginsenosidimutans TaxID=687844 RepID=UPI0013A68737|nr:hypothetical protein [Flavobacterium ginsenosidimutans]KAF2326659.1 hypothetical protein DM444_22520 [Flavobacterium ginsenosidimutans]